MQRPQETNKSGVGSNHGGQTALGRWPDAEDESEMDDYECQAANMRYTTQQLLDRTVQGELSWDDVPDNSVLWDIMLSAGVRPPLLDIRSEAGIKQEINRIHTKLFGDHKLLKEIWRRHSTTICKRWEKKSATQRLHILQQAWGGSMNDAHRPDFAMFCKSRNGLDWHDHEAHRDAILLPSINTEDLQKPRNLMVFMYSRAMYKPVEFAHMERFLQLCDNVYHLRVTELKRPYYAMMFRREVGDHEYAKLIDMRMYPQTPQWFRNHEIEPVCAGMIILEQQEKIWSFLTACAHAIMHDLPGERILDALPCKPFPLPPVDYRTSSWSEAAELTPYSAPGTINLDRMTRLLCAKRDEERDHHFYLREDPAYFMDTAHLHPWSLKFTLTDSRWKGCISATMWESFVERRAWTSLHEASELLRSRYGNRPSADQFRDINSHQALDGLIGMFRVHYEWRLKKLWRSCITSMWYDLIFADHLEVEPDTSECDTSDPAYRIATILRQVYFLGKVNRTVVGEVQLTMIIAEAQRLLQDGNPEDLLSITSAMKRNIAELATIAGPMNQLALFQDCYPDRTITDGLPSYHEWRSRMEDVSPEFRYDPGPDFKHAEFTEHCGTDPSFFPYPCQGPKTREKTDEMRQTESKLDVLWSHFDDWIQKHHLAPEEDFPEPARSLRRTEPWSDLKLKSFDSKHSSLEPVRSLSDIYRDLEINTERTLTPASSIRALAKIKLKAQSTSKKHRSSEKQTTSDCSSAPAVQAPALSEDNAVTPSTFKTKVNARALKTFKALFFIPSAGATPGEVPWKDFLYAMSSAGFQAEKMYGSAWKFDPINAASDDTSTTASAATTSDGQGTNSRSSIIFHEPHPSNKIPYTTARRHGRRLARAYGWSGETFVLAGKEKGAPVSKKEKEKQKD
jgi:hypothetical protein